MVLQLEKESRLGREREGEKWNFQEGGLGRIHIWIHSWRRAQTEGARQCGRPGAEQNGLEQRSHREPGAWVEYRNGQKVRGSWKGLAIQAYQASWVILSTWDSYLVRRKLVEDFKPRNGMKMPLRRMRTEGGEWFRRLCGPPGEREMAM